MSVKIDP